MITLTKVSCLCLLDLSAAFVTHFTSLSIWVSMASLQWFTPYLSSHKSAIAIPLSPSSPLFCDVLEAQFSVPFPSIFTLFSFLSSALPPSHIYCMLATQTFYIIINKNFLLAISDLQSTILVPPSQCHLERHRFRAQSKINLD